MTLSNEIKTSTSHEHDYSIVLAIPRKSMGAVHGYDDYRECRHCGQVAPAGAMIRKRFPFKDSEELAVTVPRAAAEQEGAR